MIAAAAATGRRKISGTVPASASRPSATVYGAEPPISVAFTVWLRPWAIAWPNAASASSAPASASALGDPAIRRRVRPVATEVIVPHCPRRPDRPRPPGRVFSPSLARGTPPRPKTALRRDDRRRHRTLASATMEATIEVAGLRKRYGPTLALDGMSFAVQPGQVTGFVGPNGAGKSTTMRVVLGLDAADDGTALIGGQPYQSLRHPLSHVGALLDAGALQPGRTARNHLLWLAHSQGLGRARVDQVIAQAGLESAAKRKAGGYSLGMRQRLGIAAALLGDPPVLMMEEPFNGMDPEGIIWMRGFLRGLAAQGRAVFVSSHLMSEL